MKKISISAELERRLRACKGIDLVDEIINLLDETEKRAAGSRNPGLGYKELVALFRSFLGSDLVLPPAANAGYVVRVVNKAREFGISKDNVEQICKGLRRAYPRGPYSLGFIVFRADLHFQNGDSEHDGGDSERHLSTNVHTGRSDS